MKVLNDSGRWIHEFLHHPVRVLWFCAFMVAASMFANGSVLRLYGLHKDEKMFGQQILQAKSQILVLEQQLKMAQDPSYIERQAVDRYDLADENDLVFVFADD